MSGTMDDLDVNPFYHYLLSTNRGYMQSVLCEGAIVVIPHSKILHAPINVEFTAQHILLPSKIYPGEYVCVRDYRDKSHSLTWSPDLSKKTITLSMKDRLLNLAPERNGQIVNILFAETAYLQKLKYRVYLVDQCLTPVQPGGSSEVVQQLIRKRNFSPNTFDLTNSTIEQIECIIRGLQNGREILQAIEGEIAMYKSSYLILPSYMEDAANKIHDIIQKILKQFNINSGKLSDNLCVMIDCVILHSLHDVLYPAVQQLCTSRKLTFQRQQQVMVSDNSPELTSVKSIDVLFSMTFTLEMLLTLKSTLVAVCDLMSKRSGSHQRNVDLASTDTLIPLVIQLLTEEESDNCCDIVSILEYLSIFGRTAFLYDDSFEFTLATFRAAVQYITDYSDDSRYESANLSQIRTPTSPRSITEIADGDSGNKPLTASQLLHNAALKHMTSRPYPTIFTSDNIQLNQYDMINALPSWGFYANQN